MLIFEARGERTAETRALGAGAVVRFGSTTHRTVLLTIAGPRLAAQGARLGGRTPAGSSQLAAMTPGLSRLLPGSELPFTAGRI